jgi:AcrR family transcriptional regulator
VNQHAVLAADHSTRILDAARRCFVRSGFHRATMQDIASEAGMSAGNIYRYFASKDAMAESLCTRDRAQIAASFAALAGSPDPLKAFIAVGERHLVNETRENAIFALDLWGEMARSPRIAAICAAFDADARRWCAGFLNEMTTSGQAHPDLDVDGLVELLLCLADGLLARKARDASFDAAPHMAHIASLVMLACSGAMPSLLKMRAQEGSNPVSGVPA